MASHINCPNCCRALKIASNKLSGECRECKMTFYFSREEYDELMRSEAPEPTEVRVGGVVISDAADRYLLKRIGELEAEIESLRSVIDVLSNAIEDLTDKGDIGKN